MQACLCRDQSSHNSAIAHSIYDGGTSTAATCWPDHHHEKGLDNAATDISNGNQPRANCDAYVDWTSLADRFYSFIQVADAEEEGCLRDA